jgi:hypothetical protein
MNLCPTILNILCIVALEYTPDTEYPTENKRQFHVSPIRFDQQMMAQPNPKHVGGILTFYGPAVLIFTTRLISKIFTYSTRNALVHFLWISEQTAIINPIQHYVIGCYNPGVFTARYGLRLQHIMQVILQTNTHVQT